MLKQIIRKLLGEKQLGALDYRRFRGVAQEWEGAFNRQQGRQQIFHELLAKFRPEYIIETGTYRGATTDYMADYYRGPIYTIEQNTRIFGFAKARLAYRTNVQAINGDSRNALQAIFSNELLLEKRGLYYLDAHWNADLPLSVEIETIYQYTSRAVLLIDDFQVKDDPGYGYDDYGGEKSLTLDYIADVIKKFNLCVYFQVEV